jgi:hypothetical protein
MRKVGAIDKMTALKIAFRVWEQGLQANNMKKFSDLRTEKPVML